MPVKMLAIHEQLCQLKSLIEQLKGVSTLSAKLKVLDAQQPVKDYLNQSPRLSALIKTLDPKEEWAIKSVLTLGQGAVIFKGFDAAEQPSERLAQLLNVLLEIELFYEDLGGILGYHYTVIRLAADKNEGLASSLKRTVYSQPPLEDISQNSSQVQAAIRWGIERLPEMSEIYPIGGAGDRLNLVDKHSGEHLPVAGMLFGGHTLLEGLIRDVQGKEYLYYKLTKKQCIMPIALMTSAEKNNHYYILEMFQKNRWFKRSSKNFKFFTQPLVPVMAEDGEWIMEAPLQLMLKPGGHGVIWKLALDQGVFDWLQARNCTKALIRQINNPVAGCDDGLLAFTGLGMHTQKIFGFASCSRLLNTAEGMDVLQEVKSSNGYEYGITNIEYTQFEQHGLHDVAQEPGSPYSAFPANTNILFVDIQKIIPFIQKYPLPGLLLNMKHQVSCVEANGQMRKKSIGRLELTMQNIADVIVSRFSKKLSKEEVGALPSYITYHKRIKTISVCKKAYVAGSSPLETPENCFYEVLQNYRDLLVHHCQMQLPEMRGIEEFLDKGPPFLVSLHPAIGPLYQIIAQKIKGGSLTFGSELVLEIAEVMIDNLMLNGSLIIEADALMGSQDAEEVLKYSEETGKCILKDVTIDNRGVDRTRGLSFACDELVRHESMTIILHGNAEFYAEGVVFSGSQTIEVPAGYRMTASEVDGKLIYCTEAIHGPGWYWKYTFDAGNRIQLEK